MLLRPNTLHAIIKVGGVAAVLCMTTLCLAPNSTRTNLSKVSAEAVPRLKVLAQSRPVAVHGTLQHEVLHVVQFSVQEGADQVLGVVVGEAQVVPP